MRRLQRTLLAIAVAAAIGATADQASAQFDNAVFFGDSLTDVGSFAPVLPPGTGRFTTNPGPVWSELVGQNYGLVVIPANRGGSDFAEGGARVTLQPGVPNSPPTGTATPVTAQITQYLARGPVDPNAIHFVWAGANDLFFQLGLLGAGQASAADVQQNLGLTATQLAGQVARLNAAGARYIVVFTMPDVGHTPSGAASGQAGQITALSSFFNSTFLGALDATGVQTLRLNPFALLNEVIANPAAYGLSNVTAPACGTTASVLCTAANLVTPNAAQTFLFADGVHVTTAGNAIIAQYATAMILAPQQMAALAEAPIAVEQAQWRALDGRMLSATNAPGRGRLETWASYDYANPDMKSGFLSGDGKLGSIAVGGDYKITDRLLAGLAFGWTDDKVDFSNSGFKLQEAMLTAYAGYGTGPWFLGATAGVGDIEFKDIHRDIALGTGTRTETGRTRGYTTIGRLIGGYWFTMGSLLHGPVARLTWQDIKVRQFQEEGSASTTMSFGEQRRRSLISSLGWQAAGTLGAVRPYARVSWEHEAKADERNVEASVYGTGGLFSVPAYRPDDNYALFTLGAAMDFGRVTGYVSASGTGSKADGNGYGVTVGIRVPL